MQVVIDNTGTANVTVTSVQLVSPGFAAKPPVERETDFEPGRRYSLPTPFGAARCDRAAVPAEAAVGLLINAQPQTVRLPLASEDGLLERLHARACAVLASAEQIGLTLGPDLTPVDEAGEPGLATTLSMTRRAETGPVELNGTAGSVLYDLVLPGGPVILAPGTQVVQVPAVLTSRTCSGHVIGEAKKPYAFVAFVAVDDAEPFAMPVEVTTEQQLQLLELTDTTCAGAP